ncbi:hypothetical protein K0M31_004758 [Melipona bicolor]|uniref:Uncharacterized protein n=1 Tax=Melipona bicolor TaxID=60889 RepID=A0AA40FVF2_9HYME|nr:hypothetical protein K0M31_004758 [Melipona bicolor]
MESIPITRYGESLRGTEERQRPVGNHCQTVYVAHGWEFRSDAAHGFCVSSVRKKRDRTRYRERRRGNLLEYQSRVPLRGAKKGHRAVHGRSKTPGVVDGREFRSHAANRL